MNNRVNHLKNLEIVQSGVLNRTQRLLCICNPSRHRAPWVLSASPATEGGRTAATMESTTADLHEELPSRDTALAVNSMRDPQCDSFKPIFHVMPSRWTRSSAYLWAPEG